MVYLIGLDILTKVIYHGVLQISNNLNILASKPALGEVLFDCSGFKIAIPKFVLSKNGLPNARQPIHIGQFCLEQLLVRDPVEVSEIII